MSRKMVRNLTDVKDSRLLYEKDLPPFGYFIVIIATVFLLALIVWSTTAHKTYIVKGNGNIVSDNKNYIMSDYAGKITKMNIAEGDYVEKGDVLFVIQSTDLELQNQQILEQAELCESQIRQYELLEKSVKDNKNYFSSTADDDKLYYNRYEEYQAKVKQNQIDVSQYQQYGYTDAQIEEAIKLNEEKIAQIYYETLSGIAGNISELKGQLEELEIQRTAINDGKSDYKIKASASGVVHMFADYKKGMVVQTAATIGSIASENDSYYVSAYIPAENMPLIEEGQRASVAVSGLSENTYGTLSGEIVRIDSDITTNSEQQESYFGVRIKPSETYLISKAGRKVNLSNGMAVEVRVKYDELTYFQYVMEALGVLTR